MPTRLLQVVSFVAVAPAATVALPHNINILDIAKKPDFVAFDAAGFTAVVTATQVSVTNLNAAPTSVNVWLELKHTIPRELGNSIANLTPQPFVAASGAGGGGSMANPMALPEQWAALAIPANVGPVVTSCQVSTNFDDIQMMRAGSIVGIRARLTDVVAQGDVTVSVTINGAPSGVNITIPDGDATSANNLAIGDFPYAASDLIGVTFTTSADFLPDGTLNLEVWLEVLEAI
jgi:hypothetical protein